MKTRKVMKTQPPEGYKYRGFDGGNPYLPKKSGHYWMSGYAMWRPLKSECPNGGAWRVGKFHNKWVWVIEAKQVQEKPKCWK